MKQLCSVAGEYFDNKEKAKLARTLSKGGNFTSTVALGPDHWRYGMKGNPRTDSHDARSGGPGNGFPKNAKRFS